MAILLGWRVGSGRMSFLRGIFQTGAGWLPRIGRYVDWHWQKIFIT
jgi:hypothetical protein